MNQSCFVSQAWHEGNDAIAEFILRRYSVCVLDFDRVYHPDSFGTENDGSQLDLLPVCDVSFVRLYQTTDADEAQLIERTAGGVHTRSR